MCLGAIYWARLDKMYYGNNKTDAKNIGFDDSFIYDELELKPEDRKLPSEILLHNEALTAFKAWAAKQDELQDPSKEGINFLTTVDNESITDAVTRSSSNLSLPLKSSFSAGDVISMSVSEQEYQPFTLGVDNQNWSETATDSEAVTFYAHYLEYLFGTAQARKGSSNVALTFKRMTAPVILLDEKGNPYEGKAIVKLFLKNKGVQDLFNGKIEAEKNATPEYISIRKISEGILTNLIPQIIKAGEKIGSVVVDDKEEPIIADQDITIEAGSPVTMRLYGGRGSIDENPRNRCRHSAFQGFFTHKSYY